MKVSEITDKIEHLEKMLIEYVNKNVLSEADKDNVGEAYSAKCISFSYSQDTTSAFLECTECGKTTQLRYMKNSTEETISYSTLKPIVK